MLNFIILKVNQTVEFTEGTCNKYYCVQCGDELYINETYKKVFSLCMGEVEPEIALWIIKGTIYNQTVRAIKIPLHEAGARIRQYHDKLRQEADKVYKQQRDKYIDSIALQQIKGTFKSIWQDEDRYKEFTKKAYKYAAAAWVAREANLKLLNHIPAIRLKKDHE